MACLGVDLKKTTPYSLCSESAGPSGFLFNAQLLSLIWLDLSAASDIVTHYLFFTWLPGHSFLLLPQWSLVYNLLY